MTITNAKNAIVVHIFHLELDQTKSEVNFTSITWYWRYEFVNYLRHWMLPEVKKQSQWLRIQDGRCSLVKENLYQKMIDGPLAKYLDPRKLHMSCEKCMKGTVVI